MKMQLQFRNILKRLFKKETYNRLKIDGRSKLSSGEFKPSHKLYRGFSSDDLDENNHLRLETIKFPDISFNWSKLSRPIDIWSRENGSVSDGCYSITVEDSRYRNMATPVHSPITNGIENYSHIEVRVLKEGEELTFEPPQNRKMSSKAKKQEYRQHIQNACRIKIKPLKTQQSTL